MNLNQLKFQLSFLALLSLPCALIFANDFPAFPGKTTAAEKPADIAATQPSTDIKTLNETAEKYLANVEEMQKLLKSHVWRNRIINTAFSLGLSIPAFIVAAFATESPVTSLLIGAGVGFGVPALARKIKRARILKASSLRYQNTDIKKLLSDFDDLLKAGKKLKKEISKSEDRSTEPKLSSAEQNFILNHGQLEQKARDILTDLNMKFLNLEGEGFKRKPGRYAIKRALQVLEARQEGLESVIDLLDLISKKSENCGPKIAMLQ